MIKHQKGAGLIEVLIAFLLLSIGGVGLASMQIKAKRMSYEAVQRSVATSLARDIIERMRNNPSSLASYVTNNLGNSSISAEPSPNCIDVACSNAQLAAHDLWEWERSLDGASEQIEVSGNSVFAGGLDTPRACITNTNGQVAVAIVWKGYQEMTNPTNSTCGEGLGLYGTNEAERQVVLIGTYVDAL
ncbi:MAG: type IV pilus modification protein PilV [Agarilytica sp.]